MTSILLISQTALSYKEEDVDQASLNEWCKWEDNKIDLNQVNQLSVDDTNAFASLFSSRLTSKLAAKVSESTLPCFYFVSATFSQVSAILKKKTQLKWNKTSKSSLV